MDDPIVLLAVLNIIPSSLSEILREIEALRLGRPHAPFGGSSAVSRFVQETDDHLRPLEPFHTKEACTEGLRKLVGFGLVKKDAAGYRLTYEGVTLTSTVIREIKKRHGPGLHVPAPKKREDQQEPEPTINLSPLSQQKMIKAYQNRFAPRGEK